MSYGVSESLTIEGLAELQRKLTGFGEKVVNVITQKALMEGAKIIQEEAKLRVPVWPNGEHNLKVGGVYIKIQPGNLKRNIRIRSVKKTEKGTKAAQVYVKLKQAWYAKFVEGQEDGTSRQPAKPFMRPAFETKEQEAVQAFENRIKEAIVEGGL